MDGGCGGMGGEGERLRFSAATSHSARAAPPPPPPAGRDDDEESTISEVRCSR